MMQLIGSVRGADEGVGGFPMRVLLLISATAAALGACSTSPTYESNLAFDLTQRAYATDRKAQAVVVSYAEAAPSRPCSDLVVC